MSKKLSAIKSKLSAFLSAFAAGVLIGFKMNFTA